MAEKLDMKSMDPMWQDTVKIRLRAEEAVICT